MAIEESAAVELNRSAPTAIVPDAYLVPTDGGYRVAPVLKTLPQADALEPHEEEIVDNAHEPA